MKKVYLLCAAALAASLSVAPAAAQQAASEEVSVGDLNLLRRADLAELDRRIDRAARRLCGVSSTSTYATRSASRQCRIAATERAQPQRSELLAQAQRGARVRTAALIMR